MIRTPTFAVVLALLGVFVTGCGSTPDSFTIRRYVVDYGNSWTFPPLDRTVTDPAVVSQIYSKLLSLPRDGGSATKEAAYAADGEGWPEGYLPPERPVFGCPMDFGIRYDLRFFRQGEPGLHAVLALACPSVDLGAGDHRVADESFWAQLAGALGFYTRGHDLFPTPLLRQ